MISKLRGSVTIPRIPRGVGNLLRWSREVNQCLQQLRDRVVVTQSSPSKPGGTSQSTCPFGELETSTDDPPVTSIRGGLMTCGDQNFNVANYVLDLDTDGERLVQIALTGVTCATDDAEEIFLPGVTTATGTPSWEVITYTGSENYDDTTNPTAPDSPTGTAIVGIGRIKILDGAATFSPTGCGTIRVGQCAGIISHSRG